jgi:ubiquinone/menaquinone biosynthesis C-methylase UbiE
MVQAAATHPGSFAVAAADMSALPLRSGCADMAVAFMSLQDVDDLQGAVMEAARILEAAGVLCVAIVHPLNSAGTFEGKGDDVDAPFVIRAAYLTELRYHELAESRGLTMEFHSVHRTIEAYSRALEREGFVIEAIREVTEEDPANRWNRIPLFLHLRARRVD